jgi:uncharacterized protein YecT (DUF1311 family)
MKKLALSACVSLAGWSFSSYAEESKYDQAYGQCTEAAGTMNNGVMAACSEETSELAKKDINSYYKQVEAKINDYDNNKAELLTKLETSQKAWIQYRNNHCALSEMLAAHEVFCLMQVNSQRAEELRALAE